MSDAARGVRNNNPGNVRIGAHWQGLMPRDQMTPEQVKEDEFCVFQAPKWGFRAMAIIFKNYARLYGVKTIREAISRWAPPSENDTEAYIKAVSDYVGVAPNDRYSFANRQNLTGLLKAVSIHECGGWKFTISDVVEGVDLAMQGAE